MVNWRLHAGGALTSSVVLLFGYRVRFVGTGPQRGYAKVGPRPTRWLCAESWSIKRCRLMLWLCAKGIWCGMGSCGCVLRVSGVMWVAVVVC